MESHNSQFFEPNYEFIIDLVALGFGEEESALAL
jgi:hypothetical protein